MVESFGVVVYRSQHGICRSIHQGGGIMKKLFPRTKQAALKLVEHMINGDCDFTMSCDLGQIEIRGYWSTYGIETMVLSAGLTMSDIDIE